MEGRQPRQPHQRLLDLQERRMIHIVVVGRGPFVRGLTLVMASSARA